MPGILLRWRNPEPVTQAGRETQGGWREPEARSGRGPDRPKAARVSGVLAQAGLTAPAAWSCLAPPLPPATMSHLPAP
eukprot:106467-Heterocapsa_arctica.AAC.1